MAFLVFPAEVWEVILGHVDDSKDVRNAFKAYPELEAEGVLRLKRHLWLFDQIIPHIFTWLSQKEVLASRLVCNQWSRAVDNFLVNHPSLRPYEHGSDVTGQLWTPIASGAHYELKDKDFCLKLSRKTTIAKYLRDMYSCPQGRNPIPGRSITISEPHDTFKAARKLWNAIPELLMKLGHHVWFLKIVLAHPESLIRFPWLLLDCLRYMPHLRGLEINTYTSCFDRCKMGKFNNPDIIMGPPQILPHLETLHLEFSRSSALSTLLVDYLVMGYAKQIRRLYIGAQFWKRGYSKLVHNLTELFINWFESADQLTDTLSSLNLPKLHRLHLSGPRYHDGPAVLTFGIVVPLLTRFPTIDSLSFNGLSADHAGIFPNVTIPSLKSLRIVGNAFCYDMENSSLEVFPNLEYLKVSGEVDVEHAWEVLPNLKEVTFYREAWRGYRTFRRAVSKGERESK